MVEEPEPKVVSPKATGDSVQQVASPSGSQNGFEDDAWIPRTVQAIKTGTYKSKAKAPVTQQPTAGDVVTSPVREQPSLTPQAPVQVVNHSGQPQIYQQQQQQPAPVQQQQPTGYQQQAPIQAVNTLGQNQSYQQQPSIPVQQQGTGYQQVPINQSYPGYQQQPNQGPSVVPQLTGVQQPIGIQQQPTAQSNTSYYVPQQPTGVQLQQQQAHFVPQQATNAHFQQQQQPMTVQPQFISQSIPNQQFQQQQYVPQQSTGIQFLQQQQPTSFYNAQPAQQSYIQPMETATVPLSNILPPPLVPSSVPFNSHQPQSSGHNLNGGMQQQPNFQGIQPLATGNRSWQSASTYNIRHLAIKH